MLAEHREHAMNKRKNLKTGATRLPSTSLENGRGYFILVKMPGIERADIVVDLYEDRRQLVVSGRRRDRWHKKIDYWVFVIPGDGALRSSTMRLQNGVLEIAIPKERMAGVA